MNLTERKPRSALPVAVWLLPLAALLITLPLWTRGGCSCGHDFQFHLESWLDAAQQLRHGVLYPAWATSPAWNAGEPRFLFYPPLSWMAGELLTLALPFGWVPAVYTTLVLAAAALSVYACARRFAQPQAAALAAALYVANPYMLFTAFERTAFAELLAAVWLPWLLAALLRERPSVVSLAVPLALLWLTNAPAGVMGSYAIAIAGLTQMWMRLRRGSAAEHASAADIRRSAWPLAARLAIGSALGLALAAVYLLPAAYERRFVEIAMALVPGLSVPANFLFGHTGDAAHDHVLLQASTIAVSLLVIALLTLAAAWTLRRRGMTLPAQPIAILAILALVIAFLLTPASLPVWNHLPELAFLQFPWRWLAVLSGTDAFLLAFVLNALPVRSTAGMVLATVCAVVLLGYPAGRDFLQPCPADQRPQAVAAQFRTSHGAAPTDEYTPHEADNDELRSDDPGWWLVPPDSPDTPAAGTVPNPNEKAPDVDFGPPPLWATLSHPAPHQLTVELPQPEVLVLNLRAYPNWLVQRSSGDGGAPLEPVQLAERGDGLVAVQLPAGRSTVVVRWRPGRDREAGLAISVGALLALAGLRRRRAHTAAPVA